MSITPAAIQKKKEQSPHPGTSANPIFIRNSDGTHIHRDENLKKTVYRFDGVSVDKVIEYNSRTGKKVKITNFDYFDNTKVKSVEDYDAVTGMKVRITNFSLFKSVTDFDIKSGKKIKTTNFDIKNETKKTSVYDFDTETGKILRITLFCPDGDSISLIKELNPQTGMPKKCVNYKRNSTLISSVSQYEFLGDKTIKTTFFYNEPAHYTNSPAFSKIVPADTPDEKVPDESKKRRINRLIDNLYKNKTSFSSVLTS